MVTSPMSYAPTSFSDFAGPQVRAFLTTGWHKVAGILLPVQLPSLSATMRRPLSFSICNFSRVTLRP
jgi:hypothetical protein